MTDTITIRAPGQDLADSMDPSFSVEDAEIDSLLTEAEERMRGSLYSTSPAAWKHSQPIKSYIHKGTSGTASITDAGRKAKASSRTSGKATGLPFMRVDDLVKVEKEKKEKKDKTAGPSWYNMPATDLTPQVKRDLQMIKLRNVIDQKKHFKGDDWKGKLPKYFQMGTLIEGPTEYYSARLNNKERKKNIVDEVLSNSANKSRFRKKYEELQAKKKSGKKEFYKKVKEKRNKRY
ncbi:hypothetical protein ABW20_dc0108071 [Dactylellina cionopaga]|nr:hypothetical protein ABW20_dc0108071 [Dactylellina cionopaga]